MVSSVNQTVPPPPPSSTGSSGSFMVVRIQGFDNRCRYYLGSSSLPTKFEIQVFSSELGKWNVHEVSSPPGLTWGKFDVGSSQWRL